MLDVFREMVEDIIGPPYIVKAYEEDGVIEVHHPFREQQWKMTLKDGVVIVGNKKVELANPANDVEGIVREEIKAFLEFWDT